MIGNLIARLAINETGRASIPCIKRKDRICVVYPDYLSYTEIISDRYSNDVTRIDYFRFDCRPGGNWGSLMSVLSLLYRLFWFARQIGSIEMYSFSSKLDFPFLFITAAVSRLFGFRITFHDYCFNHNGRSRKTKWLYCLSDMVIIGDETRQIGKYTPSTIFAHLYEFKTLAEYEKSHDESIAPRVMIYGNFELKKNFSIAKRAFEIVKQKYPRTEFDLICPAFLDEDQLSALENNIAITIVQPQDENQLSKLYANSDILVVLSSGGMNSHFIKRANVSGYPVILNETISPKSSGSHRNIFISRDSYSSLAGEIISLADDPDYYRSFSQK